MKKLIPTLLALTMAFAGLNACKSGGGNEIEVAPPPPTPTATPVPPAPTPTPVPAPTPVPDIHDQLPSDMHALNEYVRNQGWVNDVFFETDRYDLTEEARMNLEKLAEFLRKFDRVDMMVEGHCDERHTREYNLALGEKRSWAARDYLVGLGVDVSQLKTKSWGEEKPFADGHNEESWSKNRRDHFLVVQVR